MTKNTIEFIEFIESLINRGMEINGLNVYAL